ncbi:uncharacterized protein BDR25DRAFT_284873 [Lindgomyces ingoldianus]|uniref:Uncharacterized protein n=1 Tax=Lindgomyces ingoldianus TaxID=673940 RepID=A0ACB6R1Q2_9PLEO|nr:uncharacterized protein BDR25DRAFT_284873 [Lindgomyces ingoldianus]KAF2472267.1 hypothetical protein BDR25DRAFT_284873 [Lindgomyces ingoldianus]
MLQPRISPQFRPILLNFPKICTRCHQRPLRYPARTRTFTSTTAFLAASPDDEPEYIPKPLGRPIGFKKRPTSGIFIFPSSPPQSASTPQTPPKPSPTTWKESFKQRNLAKREGLKEEWSKSYFQDFKNITKYRSGKTFMANKQIFRRDVSLYFPNFTGETLASRGVLRDTTEVLEGRVSVVCVFSTDWGEKQARTFTGKSENPGLHELLEGNGDVAQMVEVNIEENPAKAWILKIVLWSLRRQKRKEDWGRYFLVRKGVSDYLREKIGLLNGRVGYVYLVDEHCKIRWAGSANAEGTEKDDLTRGFKRLIEDFKRENTSRPKARAGEERELEPQAVSAGAS